MSDTDAQSAEVDLVSSSIGETEEIILSTKSNCVGDNVTIPVSEA